MPIFMQFDPAIKGEATAAGHEGSIEIASFSWGLSQTVTQVSGGGGGAGKASFQDVHLEGNSSMASPFIAKGCASGQHFNGATLSVSKASGGQLTDYYTIKLNDVIISSYQSAGASDEQPQESFSLNFAKVEFDYKPQRSDGSLDQAVVFQWDILKNASG